MPHEVPPNPRVLVLHQNSESSDEISSFCRRVFAKAPGAFPEFNLVDARKLASSELCPADFDALVLWLTSDFLGADSITDWIEDWASCRSRKSGGSIFCLTGTSITLPLRFWKTFADSISGDDSGIDIHWQPISSEEKEDLLAEAVLHWRNYYGQREPAEFKLLCLD